MSGKGKGLLALVAGFAAGAAALFLSKEENRVKTVKAVQKAKTSARKAVRKAEISAKRVVGKAKRKVAAKKASKK